MKRILLVVFVMILFLPLIAQAADGNSKQKKRKGKRIVATKSVDCNSRKLSKKAKQACSARIARAVAEARRRAEEARRRAIARAIAAENALRKTAADNISRDITDGEDLVIRKAVVDAIGNNAATAVVMETQTGKIITIVNQDWAIRKSFSPCSTIKLVTTVAGLNEDVIDEEDQVSQDDLEKALARSKNGYFGLIGSKVGYDEFRKVATTLGLGKPTGINAPGESPGKLSFVRKTGLVYSHGYGIEMTPLQQAVMVSIIANHGKKVTPYIPKKTEKDPVTIPKTEQINLPVKDLDGAIPGMKGAAEYGTAHRGVDYLQGVAGKTGTCSATGTFTSVAPISNPKYTVVVITRGNAGKGKYAAAIVGKIYHFLLGKGTTILPPNETKNMESAIVIPK